MGLNDTPSSSRIHIAFFGRRNAGKSSLLNCIAHQNVSVVSDYPGTTTDPVRKTMELFPLGPVELIDTPGFDDDGELGEKRISQTRKILDETDIAVLVVDGTAGITDWERKYIKMFLEKALPYLVVFNKSDIASETADGLNVSVKTEEGIENFISILSKITLRKEKYIVRDYLNTGDVVVLVTPIDESSPKGRIILPQQLVLREILDAGAMAFVTQDTEYEKTLSMLKKKPGLVITDSQVYGFVEKRTPEDVMLTSFSMLLANKKGFLESAVKGAAFLNSLKDGDRILIAEACTHHRQCQDIGTVKIPGLIKKYTGKKVEFDVSDGKDFPENLSKYSLIVHCGGCMINDTLMNSRLKKAKEAGVPLTNYGTVIAFVNGILKRCLELFPGLSELI